MFPRMYPSRWLFWSKQISFQYFKHEKFHVCEFFVIFFKYKYLNWLSFIDIRVSAVIQDTNSHSINFVILWRILSQRNKIGCNSIININMKRDKIYISRRLYRTRHEKEPITWNSVKWRYSFIKIGTREYIEIWTTKNGRNRISDSYLSCALFLSFTFLLTIIVNS